MENKNIDEGVFDWIEDRYQGLKGVFTGQGYGYFKFLSSLRNIVRRLKKIDEPNDAIIKDLLKLRNNIENAKGWESLEDNKKDKLIYAIDRAVESFREYSRYVNTIEKLASRALKGKKGSTQQSNQTTTTTTTIQPITTTTTTTPITTTTTTSQLTLTSQQNVLPEDYKNKNKILENIQNIKNLMK